MQCGEERKVERVSKSLPQIRLGPPSCIPLWQPSRWPRTQPHTILGAPLLQMTRFRFSRKTQPSLGNPCSLFRTVTLSEPLAPTGEASGAPLSTFREQLQEPVFSERDVLPSQRIDFAWPQAQAVNQDGSIAPRLTASHDVAIEFLFRHNPFPLPLSLCERDLRGANHFFPFLSEPHGTAQGPQRLIDGAGRVPAVLRLNWAACWLVISSILRVASWDEISRATPCR